MREVAYVSGPYRAKTEWEVVQNIRAAERIARALWQMGIVAICPHKNTELFGGIVPDDVFIEGDLLIIERCDLLVVRSRGWSRSEGTVKEVRHANSLLKPVYFWPEDIRELRARAGAA